MKRVLSLVLMLIVADAAHSQAVCYRWFQFTYFPAQYFGSSSEIHTARVAQRNASPQTGGSGVGQFTTTYTSEGCGHSAPTGTSGSRNCTYSSQRVPVGSGACSGSGGTVNCTVFTGLVETYSYNVDPAGCPVEECEHDIGEGTWQVSTAPIGGQKWCEGLCEITAGPSQCGGPPGLQSCTTWSTVTDLTCEAGEDVQEEPPGDTEPDGDTGPPDAAGENCQAVGDGEYCATNKGDGSCGYMNDTYICLERIQEDECVALGDGGRVCNENAETTPPVPDNGTPGELADPDGQLTNENMEGETSNYNYYNGGTVGGSSRDPGTTGAMPTGGSPSYGSGTGTGGPGEESPECVGTTCGEGVPELEEIGSMTNAFTQFWDDLQAVPIVDAAMDVAPSFGAGSCPSWSDSFEVGGTSVDADFGFICTTYTDITPAITIVALVLWGFVAFRILMSA